MGQFLKHYLGLLPTTWSEFPFFWDDENLAYLEGSPAIDLSLKYKDEMIHDYNLICDEIPSFRDEYPL